MNDFVTLRNIQHTNGNLPLKGPALGSADKYAVASVSLVDQAGFPLANFVVRSEFSVNSHWLATFFEINKSRIQSYFLLFSNEKGRFAWKIHKWKTSFKIKYVNKNFVNFIQISTASHIKLWIYEVTLNELSNVSGLIF